MVTTGQIVVSRYEILGMLGKGGQGETWKARDLHQNEVVAIKFLTSQGLGPWHEASALTLLRDDHILPIRNADMASGVPYLATELAVDGTVLDKIQRPGTQASSPPWRSGGPGRRARLWPARTRRRSSIRMSSRRTYSWMVTGT